LCRHAVQYTIQNRCGRAFDLGEITIAGTHRQTVRLTQRCGALDPHRHGQILDHAPNHHQLLEVLLAEHRDIGLHHVEEFAYHGGDTDKVAWPAGAAQYARQAGHLDARLLRLRLWVHDPDTRREQQIGALFLEHLGIARQRARIAVEVFTGTKLQRVDEDTHHHPVGQLAGDLDQRQMAGVQIAHGRHEGHIAAASPDLHLGTQRADLVDSDHAR
jgi:hypothetical protein